MALVIEDGTGKADANSYASTATLKAYAKERGVTLPSSEAALEILLLKAMDTMKGLRYVGERATKEQALDWPRYNVCVDGFPFASTELPRELEQAQCALAIEWNTTDMLPTTPANAPGPVVSKTVGPISVAYASNNGASRVPHSAKAEVLLRMLLVRHGLQAVRL